jgi:Cof subfamily protein (haloacid dehalogenase superfamily)
MTNIKLIALDLDGTVLRSDRTISDRVLHTAGKAVERGRYLTIATGRGAPTVREVAAALSVNAPVICQHGSTVTDLTTGHVLWRITLPRDVACDALDFAQQHPSWHPVIFRRDDIFVAEKRFPTQAYSLTHVEPIIASDLCAELANGEPDKLMLMLDPSETRATLRLMSDFIGERATVVQSSKRLVEVHSREAHKAAGLARLADYLGVARDEVMAVGDHDNDETMLAWAGLGVAMGNGSERARTVADWIAPTIDEDGAAVAIEKFVLTI